MFSFQTLAEATARAQQEAVALGDDIFVVEVYLDNRMVSYGMKERMPLHAVAFAAYGREGLAGLLRVDVPAVLKGLTILRVAHADGTVEAVHDPGSYAARLKALVTPKE